MQVPTSLNLFKRLLKRCHFVEFCNCTINMQHKTEVWRQCISSKLGNSRNYSKHTHTMVVSWRARGVGGGGGGGEDIFGLKF